LSILLLGILAAGGAVKRFKRLQGVNEKDLKKAIVAYVAIAR
jgi:hypothetical protein